MYSFIYVCKCTCVPGVREQPVGVCSFQPPCRARDWAQANSLNSGPQSQQKYLIFLFIIFLHEYLLDFITVAHFNIGSRELRKSFHLFFFSYAKHTEVAETTSSDDQYINESSNFKTWQNALVDEPPPMNLQVALSELSGLKKKKRKSTWSWERKWWRGWGKNWGDEYGRVGLMEI